MSGLFVSVPKALWEVLKVFWSWPYDTLKGFGVAEGPMSVLRYATVLLILIMLIPELLIRVVALLLILAPLWLPIVLARLLWSYWMHYVRSAFIAKQEMVLIEVKVPREIEKSPRAMELVFAGIHNIAGGEVTFINRWIEGKVRPWWSFEMVSIGGQVHFYVWLRKGVREYTETQIYAQYPGVEIYPAKDYALEFQYNPDRHSVWGCNFKLTKADVYPIKTYVDYELDKDPKEEFKIDPLAHMMEYLSSLKPGEQAWLQFIIRSDKDQRPKLLNAKTKQTAWFETEDRWKTEAKEEIAKIKKDATPEVEGPDGTKRAGFMSLTPADEQKIKALERSMDKAAFDVGIRGVYVAENEAFKPSRIGGLTGVFKQFGSGHLNGIMPNAYMAVFDYPWQKWFNAEAKMRAALVDAYRKRAWFFLADNPTKHFVMTSEELATVYHFPSSTVQAPGIERIGAQKAAPPPNLPI